jgi:hypothetical protein
MQEFNQSTAICKIFTYKEGVLSYLAHDLRINVTSFTILLGGKDHFLEAHFDARSLRVDCAMENGRERPDLLSSRDRNDIDNNIIRDVLHADKYPDSMLLSSSVKKERENYLVKADLTLAGRKKEISFEVRKEDSQRYSADVRLNLPDFGITPFSAFFGAIRIKPHILIHIEIPANGITEELSVQ